MKTIVKTAAFAALLTTIVPAFGMARLWSNIRTAGSTFSARFAARNTLGQRLLFANKIKNVGNFNPFARTVQAARPGSFWSNLGKATGFAGSALFAARVATYDVDETAREAAQEAIKDAEIHKALVGSDEQWNAILPRVDHYVFKRCTPEHQGDYQQCAQLRKATREAVNVYRTKALEKYMQKAEGIAHAMFNEIQATPVFKDTNGNQVSIFTAPQEGVVKIIENASLKKCPHVPSHPICERASAIVFDKIKKLRLANDEAEQPAEQPQAQPSRMGATYQEEDPETGKMVEKHMGHGA